MLQRRLTRIFPHLIDTILLVSAVTLVWQYQLSPLQQPWLISKIVALLAYIGLGTVALKRGKTKAQRTGALIGALFCFAFIVAAAITKSPWGLLAWV